MRSHLLGLVVVIASCGRSAAERTITSIAESRETMKWLGDACGNGRVYSTTMLQDYTLPPEMRVVTVTHCANMFTSIVDARIETQSGVGGVCAVRIGPSLATASVDASSVSALFADKQLGARIGTAIGPATPGPTHNFIGMFDGVRVALSQTETSRGILFYLVLDGCIHAQDVSPDTSSVN